MYGEKDVRQVRFIKRAQTRGFTLKETSSLLSFEQVENCCETKELAERKVKEIDSRIADLQRMKKTLGICP